MPAVETPSDLDFPTWRQLLGRWYRRPDEYRLSLDEIIHLHTAAGYACARPFRLWNLRIKAIGRGCIHDITADFGGSLVWAFAWHAAADSRDQS